MTLYELIQKKGLVNPLGMQIYFLLSADKGEELEVKGFDICLQKSPKEGTFYPALKTFYVEGGITYADTAIIPGKFNEMIWPLFREKSSKYRLLGVAEEMFNTRSDDVEILRLKFVLDKVLAKVFPKWGLGEKGEDKDA